LIFDTNVLIWYLRGDQSARVLVKQNTPFSVSAVTYLELVQGMRNKNEFRSFPPERSSTCKSTLWIFRPETPQWSHVVT